MHLLASCSACKRQYDARGLKPADHFRCSCGTLVTVAAPTSAILAVAHCGTCGAARTTQGRTCTFCHSAFADRDLRRDTMCPACYGHIADQAKFCDHCGLAIQPTRLAGKSSALPCPVCSRVTLHTRHLPEADHPIDECARCGGVWLDILVFDRVIDTARRQTATTAATTRTLKAQQGNLYRSCPVCRELMNRRNYGGSSAVIIDSCKAHGLWFDAEELNHLVVWIRAGGQDRQRERELADEKHRKLIRSTLPAQMTEVEVNDEKNPLFEIGLELLGRAVGSIFRRL